MPRRALKRETTMIEDIPIPMHQDVHTSDDTVLNSDADVDADGQMKQVQEANTSSQGPLTLNGGIQTLGRGVKELVQAVQALRHLGVEDLDLPLPKIVVVGDQSTGKSSLIEGMSEIKVPRKAGTCTRCPLEINLTETTENAWSCKVSLFKKYTYEGNLQTASSAASKGSFRTEGATKTRPLGPWTIQEPEDFFFANISSKSNVADVLWRAQLATLNPGSSFQKYLPSVPSPSTSMQVKFSPNIVRLDISGPELPNLSFYDLPGVINVSDMAGEEYLVDLVRNLVKSYIVDEDSINLLAIPMTDDPANSSAFHLIKQVKAEARTLGCITKPDRREKGECLEQWHQLLEGQRFKLGLGFFVVKNNPDPIVDHAIARQEEDEFFAGEEPWGTTLAGHRARFGTIKLQTKLSQLLTNQIRRVLPQITLQVQAKAADIDIQLSRLPEPIDGNLPAIVIGELLNFVNGLKDHLKGGTKNHPFLKYWDIEAKKFQAALGNSKPTIYFSNFPSRRARDANTPEQSMQGTPTPESRSTVTIAIDSGDEEGQPTPVSSSKKRKLNHIVETPKKSPKIASPNQISPVGRKLAKTFTFDEIKDIMDNAYVGNIPSQIHPQAISEMIILSIEHWHEPLGNFLYQTKNLCQEMVLQQIHQTFGHRQHTQYWEQIVEVCRDFLEQVFGDFVRLTSRMLDWETRSPKTLFKESQAKAQHEAHKVLMEHSRRIRAQEYLIREAARKNKETPDLTNDDYKKVKDEDLPAETHRMEISAMAAVKAYYEIAHTRFVDQVCLSMQTEVFDRCRDNFFDALRIKFDATEEGAQERLAVLLAADAHDEERRAALMREKDTIAKARARLEGLL